MKYFTFIPGNGRLLYDGNECAMSLRHLIGLSAKAKKHKRKLELSIRDCERNRHSLNNFTHAQLLSVVQKDVEVFKKHATEQDLAAAQFRFFNADFSAVSFIPQTSCAELNFAIIMSYIKEDMNRNYLASSFRSLQKENFEIKPYKRGGDQQNISEFLC